MGDKPQCSQLNVNFAVRRLTMINRQERNLGLNRDGARKEFSTVLKDNQFRTLNIDLEKVYPFNFGKIVQSTRLNAPAPLDDLTIRP